MDAVPARYFRQTLGDILAGNPVDLWTHTGELESPIRYVTDGLILKCELADPPSMRGRKVKVWITGEEVEWLLKELRNVAIERRR